MKISGIFARRCGAWYTPLIMVLLQVTKFSATQGKVDSDKMVSHKQPVGIVNSERQMDHHKPISS